MVSVAHAAEAAPAAGGFGAFIPLILIFVIFYFLLIRPQQKKAKEHQQFLAAMKIGDEVITSGGIQGTITGLSDNVVTLEIADKTRVKVARPYIMGPVSQDLGMARPAGG
ncbi:preprotein translocase subunit YajC [Desulfurivibrio alkaliphilus]|uniref:Sec translocon accessory complex subunit YajC n=1 Tax=Desulfurivibrio alkaliphilus (strain DSM 19089 / UNIQEM U267 / AHT2) TaxID=589865 RepID=D6Z4W8_DESAT|nr:preprotein translocase subunit YajC [Desulfurivibrio alkaliphilus]ADH86593.1 preprotein translocase, YajC subunit [Desulfurivibrio alkaliphilus AHT 2]